MGGLADRCARVEQRPASRRASGVVLIGGADQHTKRRAAHVDDEVAFSGRLPPIRRVGTCHAAPGSAGLIRSWGWGYVSGVVISETPEPRHR